MTVSLDLKIGLIEIAVPIDILLSCNKSSWRILSVIFNLSSLLSGKNISQFKPKGWTFDG